MLKHTRIGWGWVAALWALGSAAGAAAQTAAPTPTPAAEAAPADATTGETGPEAAYFALIEKALKEYQLGNWSEAKSFFARAHELRPSARTLRGLGLASYELRSYVEAIGFLRAALDTRERPLTEALAKQARELLAQAQGFVARYELRLSPEDAVLKVDGLAPALDADGLLLLDPGPHEIVVRADAHEPVTRRVVARANTRSTLKLELKRRAEPGLATESQAAQDAGFFATRTSQQWVGLGLAAGGVAGLATSAVFAVIATGQNDDSEPNCEGNRCNDTGLEDRNAARSSGNVSTVAFIAGTGLLAAGAVLYLTGGASDDEPPSSDVALRLAPHASADGAGLALWGRFQ